MPLISTSRSPEWVHKDVFSIHEDAAEHQDIRPLRIGFINYMPDKAFVATEQDFIFPIIEAAGVLQFEVFLFASATVERTPDIAQYISNHYQEISQEALEKCDILIQSGTNEVHIDGTSFDFANGEVAQEIIQNFRLAQKAGVTTQVASCFASQVIAHNVYGITIERTPAQKKLLGVFPHEVTKEAEKNFVSRNLNSEFSVVYARNHRLNSSEISQHTILRPLVVSTSEISGQHETHLFYDPKELFFGFQGHPEYQKFAILKEYLRDVGVFYRDPENITFPEIPPNYFTKKGFTKMQNFTEEVKKVSIIRQNLMRKTKRGDWEFVSAEFDKKNRPQVSVSIYDEVIQSWKDTGDKVWARIFNASYQLTGFEPGQKLTQKRGVDQHEYPLETLV